MRLLSLIEEDQAINNAYGQTQMQTKEMSIEHDKNI